MREAKCNEDHWKHPEGVCWHQQKLESINDEIMALAQKKTLLENTIIELKKDSDMFAFEAEKQSKLELLSKSNTLKRAANDKQTELDECLKAKKQLLERKKQL